MTRRRKRDSYSRRVQRVVRDVAGDVGPDVINLWEFPAADFAAWRELIGDPQPATHAEYLALLASVQADQERLGRRVVRVRLGVPEMVAELLARRWPNDPQHRAAVIGLLADPR